MYITLWLYNFNVLRVIDDQNSLFFVIILFNLNIFFTRNDWFNGTLITYQSSMKSAPTQKNIYWS